MLINLRFVRSMCFSCIKVVFGNVCQEEEEEAEEKVGQKFTSTSNTSLISLLEYVNFRV